MKTRSLLHRLEAEDGAVWKVPINQAAPIPVCRLNGFNISLSDGTAFFTGALPRDAASFAFDLGDACETTMANDTDFPIAILALEEPMDQAVYACRLNQVTGRVWVNYVGAEGEDTLAPTAAPTLTSTLAPVRELIPGLFGEN
jgi:hypothetical protein